ncbi:serine protease [Flavobacterium sp. WG21]|uniref:S1 family peptidase n=1 Tax=Flavobacterium sp. WG21 TaxID=1229487 RepID=UPI000345F65E|nr:serine protease [Flavobacterium sp. WG21]
MITTHIISRTNQIKYNASVGTSFIFDYKNKQYFITAKHVVNNLKNNDFVELFYNKQWNKYLIKLVGHSANSDITVFSIPDFLDKSDGIKANSNEMVYSQETFFLGYPYGMQNIISNFNSEFPVPFVKKGILSNIFIEKNFKILFLDGINNPGFSGGPIIYYNKKNNEFFLGGIISGYKPEIQNATQKNMEIDIQYSTNTGIIIGYGIEEALKLIESNPIGTKI